MVETVLAVIVGVPFWVLPTRVHAATDDDVEEEIRRGPRAPDGWAGGRSASRTHGAAHAAEVDVPASGQLNQHGATRRGSHGQQHVTPWRRSAENGVLGLIQ
jgi:hypothetical protein